MSRLRLGMLGAIAAVMGAGSGPQFGGDANPVVCDERRQRDRDVKLARKDRLVAKAEAKRARKRDRDLLLAEDEKWRETTRRNRPALDAWIANALAKHEPALRYLADSRSAPLGSPRSDIEDTNG